MKWNKHANLEGSHAIFGASQPVWLNYDQQKLLDIYDSKLAAARGTAYHEFAQHCINMREKLPRSQRTLNMFVNDAIAYNMKSELVLYYSDFFFGTTDAISFSKEGKHKEKPILRIHDLKTGTTKVHMEQLLIYAALFCLEYHVIPGEIDMELRIYQNNDILYCNPTAEDIAPIMDKIITFDKILKEKKAEEGE